jgi:hypothetical protein
MRRRPAGWRRQSRRSQRSGVRSGTKPSAKMNLPVAYRQFPVRLRKTSFRTDGCVTGNGPSLVGCRERRENSNAPVVRAARGSGFLVVIGSAADEIFSREWHVRDASRHPHLQNMFLTPRFQRSQHRAKLQSLGGDDILRPRRMIGIEASFDDPAVLERLQPRRQRVGTDSGQ